MQRKLSAAVILAAATVLAFAASAGAVDGTIDINQAKVVAAGGFPYVISTANRSYRLTGSLSVSAINTDAIDVSVNSVTIDLNGFSIVGPGSGNGVGIAAPSRTSIEVKNGIVSGFANGGGIITGSNGIVRNVTASSNFDAIITGNYSLIKDCAVNSNVASGIQCQGSGCTISGNTSSSNGATGIFCQSSGCVISGNTTNSDANAGIWCVGTGCLISANAINGNGYGILANSSTTGYGGNVLNGNTTNVSGGTSMGTNLCSGAAC